MEIETRIRSILADQLEVAPEVLAATGPTTPLIGRGIGLDSVQALGLAVGVEAEFGIRISDEDLTVDLFADLASLTRFVLEKLSRKGGASA